jgi:hypothetical protein
LKKGEGEDQKGDEEGKPDERERDILTVFKDAAAIIDENADEFVLKLTAIHDDWSKKRSSKRMKEEKEK